MRLTDFVNELQNHGWEPVHDAQHREIEKLWRKMFPVVALLHDEINQLEKDIQEYVEAQPPV
jgi:hypothetical protein